MAHLARRVQVLLSDSQYAELDAQARRRRKSVGAVIRDAITEHLSKDDQIERLDAVQRLGALQLPVSGWQQMERESAEAPDAT
jgi:hypothetical protein